VASPSYVIRDREIYFIRMFIVLIVGILIPNPYPSISAGIEPFTHDGYSQEELDKKPF